MPNWKKTIFVNAIKALIEAEGKPAAEIVATYTKLTEAERIELLAEFPA